MGHSYTHQVAASFCASDGPPWTALELSPFSIVLGAALPFDASGWGLAAISR